MKTVRSAVVVALAASLAGCGACTSPVDVPGSTVPGSCDVVEPLIEPQKLDILLVVDNSGSMYSKQLNVSKELVAFVDEVKKGGGIPLDFHVGVVTTSIYQQTVINGVHGMRTYPSQSGRLQAVPDVGPDGGAVPGTGTERMLRGDDPDLIAKFSRLVQVGTYGSGQETPFEAARLALTLPDLVNVPIEQGGNAGFLRDRARLLVVVVSDENDCSETARPPVAYVDNDTSRDLCTSNSSSLTPVSAYYDIFSTLTDGTGARRDVVWAEIAPVGITDKSVAQTVDPGVPLQVRNVDCPNSFGPGFRHRQMAELWDPTLSNLDSVCKASFRETLVHIASLANVSQTIEVSNIPDPRLLQVSLTRADDTEVLCTKGNGGIAAYDNPVDGQPGRIHFANQCRRRADDKQVAIRLLCAG